LIKIGGGAAAIASIVGVVAMVAQFRGGVDAESLHDLRFTLGAPRVTPMRYGDFLDRLGSSTQGLSRADLRTPGVEVDYSATWQRAKKHHEYTTSVALFERRGRFSHKLTELPGPQLRLDGPADQCGCSDFIDVPQRKGQFFVAVAVYDTGRTPLDRKTSALFSGA
jgi:hypothetical protein